MSAWFFKKRSRPGFDAVAASALVALVGVALVVG
jgi:hypothetical protein